MKRGEGSGQVVQKSSNKERNLMVKMNNYYIVSLFVLLPFGIVWIATLVLSFGKYSQIPKQLLNNDILLKKALGRLRTWLISTTFWMIAEYLFVIIPFIANVIVIHLSIQPVPETKQILVYSSVSLSFIVFGYAINPQRHKKSYRRAYDVLDTALNNYLLSLETNCDNKEKLVNALRDGERFINASYDIE